MNPLTQIKNTQKATQREIAAGISESASWHAKFKHSAYVFAGGLTYGLTEGDLLAVFSQYGEIVDVNLVRDRDTGKSRGFAFLAYEDQRSTVLAVDNLSGSKVAGRIVKVDHVDNYKLKRAEVEGREVSSSDEEEGDGDAEEAAEAAAAAAAEGAEVVAAGDAGPGARRGAAETDDAPWANSNSILNLLSGPAPAKRPAAAAGLDAKDHGNGASAKKARKEKKEKKHKRHKHDANGTGDDETAPPAHTEHAQQDAHRPHSRHPGSRPEDDRPSLRREPPDGRRHAHDRDAVASPVERHEGGGRRQSSHREEREDRGHRGERDDNGRQGEREDRLHREDRDDRSRRRPDDAYDRHRGRPESRHAWQRRR